MNDKNIMLMLQFLINNVDILTDYLELNNIRFIKNSENTSIRMDSIDSDNYNGLCVDLNTMYYFDFKTSEKGDIIHLLSIILGKHKRLILLELQKLIDNNNIEKVDIKEVKSNTFNKITKKELLIYPKKMLDLYPITISELFEDDGINEITQILYGIRFDKESNRILIPVIFKNNLVGLIGRLNANDVPKNVPKYFPILAYPKGEVLFGYDENSVYIKETKSVILVESEKSVMKSTQIGLNYTLAVGGSHISNTQISILKDLDVKNIFICFDSDKEIESLKKQINKTFKEEKFNLYIVDNNTDKVDKKSCIFDMNFNKKEIINYIKKYKIKIKEE